MNCSKKLAYSYEKFPFTESFHEPLKLERGELYSRLKQSTPNNEDVTRTQTQTINDK